MSARHEEPRDRGKDSGHGHLFGTNRPRLAINHPKLMNDRPIDVFWNYPSIKPLKVPGPPQAEQSFILDISSGENVPC
jgi:hypothetical protein